MYKTFFLHASSLFAAIIFTSPLMADEAYESNLKVDNTFKKVTMHAIDNNGVGKVIGILTLRNAPEALEIVPELSGLKPGAHGFHLHVNPNCGASLANVKKQAGSAAGGHYDPANTGVHGGPYGAGHDGDLSILMVDAKGKADQPVIAPRLRIADVIGHSLIIHADSDNYSDLPKPLGGAGARVACGVVE